MDLVLRCLVSTSDDTFGVGELIEIDVFEEEMALAEDDYGRFLTDIHGDRYYCYSFVRLDEYLKRKDLSCFVDRSRIRRRHE